MPYVKSGIASKELGVSAHTLRSWADDGTIKCIRGGGGTGQRLYDIDSYRNKYDNISSITPHTFPHPTSCQSDTGITPKKSYIYCRVSSYKQKDDLDSQIFYMQEKYPTHEIVKDIASGINFKRKGLNTILAEAIKGNVHEIVVAHKDRLCRIAWDHFYWLFSHLGVSLLDDSRDEHSPESELADDLFSIIHVFSCRHYGQRRGYASKNHAGYSNQKQTENLKHEEIEINQEECTN